ncbi:MAG: MATE family efflux transporter [Pseudomonadota bacterium]
MDTTTKAKPAPKQLSRAKLTEGSVTKGLLSLVIPMVIGIVAVISQPVVDTYFVGLLGTRELAAMAYIFPVSFILSSVLIGIGVGATAVIARQIGSGDWAVVQVATLHTLLLAVAMSLVIAALLWPLQSIIFQVLGADASLIPVILDYMYVYLIGMIGMVPAMISSSALRSKGDVTLSSGIMILSAATNAALDPLLIFGWGPIPALGFQGAALASIAANLLAGALGIALLLRGDRMLGLVVGPLDGLIDNWKRILHVGLPSAVTNSISPISAAFLVSIVSQFGEAAVAAWGVSIRVEMLALVLALALSACIGPFVAQNMGAGRIDRMRAAMRLAFTLGTAYSILVWAVLSLFAEPIASAFDDNPDTILYAVRYLETAPAAYAFYTFIMITAGAFNALSIPRPNMVLYSLKLIGIYLPLAWYAAPRYGFDGVIVASIVSNVIPGIGAIIWYKARFPKIREALQPELSAA